MKTFWPFKANNNNNAMKKILQKTNWERYNRSAEGQEVISLFNHLCSPECTANEMLEAILRFDSNALQNLGKKEETAFLDVLRSFDQMIADNIPV